MSERTKQRKVRVGPLDNMRRCRRELSRVYRECRNGGISTDQLKAFTHCLRTLAEMIEAGELEDRLDHVEEAMERKRCADHAKPNGHQAQADRPA